MTYLDKTYLTDQSTTVGDLKATLNTDEQMENIAYLIQHDIFTETNENLLLAKLGLPDEQPWSMKISWNTLILLLKIILKRKNVDVILSLWTRFLSRLSQSSDELTREHRQILLILSHQLSLSQRKTVLLYLVQIMVKSKENLYFLLLLDYWMFHFYEIPAEMIEQLQQIIAKTDTNVGTSPFTQILVKTSTSTQLDGFTLKTLYQSSTYHSFYTYLVEQLDFTKLSGGTAKAYYDLLWRILGYLPPSGEYLAQASTYTASAYLLHSFRLEKKNLLEKAIGEFLGKEATLSTPPRFAQLSTKDESSVFDLIVYHILLQNLSPTKEEIHQLYRIFLEQFQASLKLDPYLQVLATIPIAKPSEEMTTTTAVTLPTLPTDFEELLKFQLKAFADQADLRSMCLRELLQVLVQQHPELDDKSLYLAIQLNSHLAFLKDQVKLAASQSESITDDLTEFIYRQIFRLLFDVDLPNALITDQIYHDLIKYLDEHFSPSIFERCLTPHDLFDLLYLTSAETRSVSVFARMLMLFNKIFSSSLPPPFISSLNRLSSLTEDDLSRWLTKLVLPEKKEELYTPEQCKQILETFTKYLIKKNDDGSTTMIDERVSRALLTVLIRLGEELLKPSKLALGFSQIIQLLVILAGHGSGQGHEQLFQATTRWLTFCANVLDKQQDDELFHSNILEASIYLLAYLNDILIALKHLSTANITLESDNDDEPLDDEDETESDASVVPSTSSEYDPNKLCTYTTTKKEYANQHWYHCHSCKMIERVGICQVCANVCHKDHEISYAKFGSFFCDRGAEEDGTCQALVKRPTNTTNMSPLMGLKKRSSAATKKTNNNNNNNNNKGTLTHRQRRLMRQISAKKEMYQSLDEVTRQARRFFEYLQSSLADRYQEIFNRENRFDLIETFLRCAEQVNIESSDSSSLFNGVLHSQENTFEHLKLSFTNEHGQQIKQLLSTNSIRRQGMFVNVGEQHLIISQEKGKQAMISIYQLNSLLKQSHSMMNTNSNPVSNDNSTKKKFTVNKLNTVNVPFTVLSMQVNQLNSSYLSLTGFKDCQVWNIDNHGRLKEPTIIVQPNLDSSGNYIIRAQWLADRHQTHLALLTADFIKIFDVSADAICPIYYFILPTG